ncbi:MAG: zinc metallopeptidase [Ardenticatenaceae bacterium]|nr:zinc metallopeptidase [Anaerolineales bacterium]MCB8921014.1 zinc metallopeptidase [Ardenticatenaceae bacterium]MCB9004191.1 zinc metallopeptidase [Ardenticatenaceae bacterium]
MFYFNPLYLVFALPGLLLGLWAQSRVKSAFNKYSRVRTLRNMTGAEVARSLLDAEGLFDVSIEEVKGTLSDHYDPRSKVLRLSPDVYRSPSVAAAGVAAHEMGHALQDASHYAPLKLRSGLVPAVRFGSTLAPWIFIAGFMLNFTTLAWVGVILFSASALFSLVTLPVEFDASRRAKKLLVSSGILVGDEAQGVDKVLDAAAMTYVAAAIAAIGTLLYYVFLLSGSRGRR